VPISLVPIGLAVSCKDTCLCCRYNLIIVFVFSSVCFDLVCIFICCCVCCRHGFISTSGVYAARMCELDIGRIIQAPWFLRHGWVFLHPTSIERIWMRWICRPLSWPQMLSTVRHVLLSGSPFTPDGSNTVHAW